MVGVSGERVDFPTAIGEALKKSSSVLRQVACAHSGVARGTLVSRRACAEFESPFGPRARFLGLLFGCKVGTGTGKFEAQ